MNAERGAEEDSEHHCIARPSTHRLDIRRQHGAEEKDACQLQRQSTLCLLQCNRIFTSRRTPTRYQVGVTARNLFST